MLSYKYWLCSALRFLLACTLSGQILFCASVSENNVQYNSGKLHSAARSGVLLESRIAGGHFASKNEFPSIVALKGDDNNLYCACTIIHPKWVVTAASCVVDVDAVVSSMVLAAGAHNISSQNEADQQIRKILRILIHPECTSKPFKNDIALIEVEDALALNNAVKAVRLQPKNKQIEESSQGIIAGWGDYAVEVGSDVLEILLKATVPFVEQENCKKKYAGDVDLLSSMFCAGKIGVGACEFDTGGPLYCRLKGEGNTRFLCGIVSGGSIDCGFEAFPGIYMRIASYVDWISEGTKNAQVLQQ